MPNKVLGQHWLFDTKSLAAMCKAAELTPNDTVLEIGPGLGPLTSELVQQAKKVVAVELDSALASALPERIETTNLDVVNQDILKFNLASLPAGYKVVANVPYYITSNLVRFLLESPTPPELVVMLVQKEVAERLAARPGNMSVLAVSAQLYATVSLSMVVTADKFDPPPKVDSQIVILRRREQPLFPDSDYKKFFRVVKAGFGEKRKTLRNSLSGGLRLSKPEVEVLLTKVGLQPNSRAQELDLAAWYALTLLIAQESL